MSLIGSVAEGAQLLAWLFFGPDLASYEQSG